MKKYLTDALTAIVVSTLIIGLTYLAIAFVVGGWYPIEGEMIRFFCLCVVTISLWWAIHNNHNYD